MKEKKCIPCQFANSTLPKEKLNQLFGNLKTGWKVIDEHHLERKFKFDDFKQALNFTNLLGELAENEGHHPDIHLSYGSVVITLWTHKVDGLTESDFILAKKIDERFKA